MRTVAVPVLPTGRHDVSVLPPQVHISTGYDDLRGRLADAGSAQATEHSRARLDDVVLDVVHRGTPVARWVVPAESRLGHAHQPPTRTSGRVRVLIG
ncbi:hypothetical protein ACIBSV_11530 [Embleya sp. NPDC050154]|uniref:hypothetical protein n=1 Tax=Embleya sp. NPDC050154 TaxID=3363988 RepID=UPI0037A0A7AF